MTNRITVTIAADDPDELQHAHLRIKDGMKQRYRLVEERRGALLFEFNPDAYANQQRTQYAKGRPDL